VRFVISKNLDMSVHHSYAAGRTWAHSASSTVSTLVCRCWAPRRVPAACWFAPVEHLHTNLSNLASTNSVMFCWVVGNEQSEGTLWSFSSGLLGSGSWGDELGCVVKQQICERSWSGIL